MAAPPPPQNALTGDPKQYPPNHWANGITGTCLCGSISVTIKENVFDDYPNSYLCHCSNCRKVSGSYAAPNLRIVREKVDIVDSEGTMRHFVDSNTGSGKPIRRYFCSRCGSPIKSESERFPDLYVLKMGIFPQIPKPQFEVFAEHRHAWQGLHDGVEQFATVAGGKKLGE